jgi:hypothetical protein
MTFRSIVTNTLICSAVALATVASASANEIQDRYCLQGDSWGGQGNCMFSTYNQCMASASSTGASCGINPAYGYTRPQRDLMLYYGGARR